MSPKHLQGSLTVPDAIHIRDYANGDRDELLLCISELQDAERALDPRLPAGSQMATAYLADIESHVEAWTGRGLVAESGGRIAGFACIYLRVPFDWADDPPGTYALLSDLVGRDSRRERQ